MHKINICIPKGKKWRSSQDRLRQDWDPVGKIENLKLYVPYLELPVAVLSLNKLVQPHGMWGLSLGLGLQRVWSFSRWTSHTLWISDSMDFLLHFKLCLYSFMHNTLGSSTRRTPSCILPGLVPSATSVLNSLPFTLGYYVPCRWKQYLTASLRWARSHRSAVEAISVYLHSWTWNNIA